MVGLSDRLMKGGKPTNVDGMVNYKRVAENLGLTLAMQMSKIQSRSGMRSPVQLLNSICIDNVMTIQDDRLSKGRMPMPAVLRKKDDVIQIRASADTKAMIARAADMRGQKLSEFMLDSARKQAEETLLDQRLFLLNDTRYDAFVAHLDNPPEMSSEAKARLARRAPWQ
ncbi:MAG: DUF1778 domain-containing protein [Beijerinckiaceae bacterium]